MAKCQKSGIFEHIQNHRFRTKAQGLSLNVIIIAALALLVLVILAVIFMGRAGMFRRESGDCGVVGGYCSRTGCTGDFERQVGYDCDLEKFTVFDIIHKDEFSYAINSFSELINNGLFKNYKARTLTKTNEVKWVQINANIIYDNDKKPLFVHGIVRNITRDNWDELFDIKDSTVYNCTPVDITDWVHKSNDFIDCRVTSQTGLDLATLQASKQFELYTGGMEFPL